MFFNVEEVGNNEDDIPTKKETESESSRFQTENENCRRKKGIGCKKIKRKKEIISIGHIIVVFSSLCRFMQKVDDV